MKMPVEKAERLVGAVSLFGTLAGACGHRVVIKARGEFIIPGAFIPE